MRAPLLLSTLTLAAALTLTGAGPAAADPTLDAARRLRETAANPALPADARAQLIKQAEELEASARRNGPLPNAPKPEPTLAEQLIARHGRLDWLAPLPACAGYTPETYLTFRYSAAINDRDTHCRNGYGHWATYLRVSKAGDAEAAGQALFYYNAAAERAVGLAAGR